MIRLNFVVEGQTEETFVRRILVPHLAGFSVFAYPRQVHTRQTYRGGLSNYEKLRNDLRCWIKQERHPDVFFTTMIDFYALPTNFPDFEAAGRISDIRGKIDLLEASFLRDIENTIDAQVHFVPYIQLHEFETLLFSKPELLPCAVGTMGQVDQLIQDVREFDDIEMINGNNTTSPSKRIIKFIPEYGDQKATAGPIVAEHIGLNCLRSRCRHFDAWLTQLEQLSIK